MKKFSGRRTLAVIALAIFTASVIWSMFMAIDAMGTVE